MGNTVHSDSAFRDAFLEGAARAFFVMAYANFVEDEDREDDGHEYPAATMGANWMDYAPERTPPNAYALAGELWYGLGENGFSPYLMAMHAKYADGVEPDPEDMGHDFAMMAMGTGVSWFDDHAEWPNENFTDQKIKVPMIECSSCTFDPAAYREE